MMNKLFIPLLIVMTLLAVLWIYMYWINPDRFGACVQLCLGTGKKADICLSQCQDELSRKVRKTDDQKTILYFKSIGDLTEKCKKGEISENGLEQLIKNLRDKEDENSIRALVVLRKYCSDGALTEDLNGILGVNILTSNPEKLLQALTLEDKEKNLLEALAGAQGLSGEGPFIDCDKSCIPRLEAFFDKKYNVLDSLRVQGEIKGFRNALKQHVKSEKEEARNRILSQKGMPNTS